MKIFIDTANIGEIKKANEWGVIDGVTTNPTLVAREGKDFRTVIDEILDVVDGPISVEVISTDAEGMVKEALETSQWSENVVVKVPMIPEGLKAIKILSDKGIKTNATLIFSVNQALLAAKAGATYVSPFIGRLDDLGQDGMQMVRDLVTIYNLYDIKTEIIVASIRGPMHVMESAKAGAHIATIPFGVIEKMFKHPLTDSGLDSFLSDWNNSQK